MKIVTGLLIALLAAPAAGGGIAIEDPWARASLGNVPNSAAYMTIRSDAPDRLTGASSPAAGRVELHRTMDHAGVSTMRPVEALAVGPDGPTHLQPGGLHLMLMGLQQKLVEGETIEVELTFEEAGAMTVQVPIRGIGAGAPAAGHDHSGG